MVAKKPPQFGPGMEGEGDKASDKRYRDAASAFAKSGKVEPGAREAKRAVDEAEAMDAAVAEGRSRSAGDLPREEAHPKP